MSTVGLGFGGTLWVGCIGGGTTLAVAFAEEDADGVAGKPGTPAAVAGASTGVLTEGCGLFPPLGVVSVGLRKAT